MTNEKRVFLRRVETDFIRDHFPHSVIHGMASSGNRRSSLGFAWPTSQLTLSSDNLWDEPDWTKEAARLIGSDWVALAKRLGQESIQTRMVLKDYWKAATRY